LVQSHGAKIFAIGYKQSIVAVVDNLGTFLKKTVLSNHENPSTGAEFSRQRKRFQVQWRPLCQ